MFSQAYQIEPEQQNSKKLNLHLLSALKANFLTRWITKESTNLTVQPFTKSERDLILKLAIQGANSTMHHLASVATILISKCTSHVNTQTIRPRPLLTLSFLRQNKQWKGLNRLVIDTSYGKHEPPIRLTAVSSTLESATEYWIKIFL